MPSELKPCPFCGKVPKIERVYTGVECGEYVVMYKIECQECRIGFRGNSIVSMTSDGVPSLVQDGYTECIKQWNGRVEDAK